MMWSFAAIFDFHTTARPSSLSTSARPQTWEWSCAASGSAAIFKTHFPSPAPPLSFFFLCLSLWFDSGQSGGELVGSVQLFFLFFGWRRGNRTVWVQEENSDVVSLLFSGWGGEAESNVRTQSWWSHSPKIQKNLLHFKIGQNFAYGWPSKEVILLLYLIFKAWMCLRSPIKKKKKSDTFWSFCNWNGQWVCRPRCVLEMTCLVMWAGERWGEEREREGERGWIYPSLDLRCELWIVTFYSLLCVVFFFFFLCLCLHQFYVTKWIVWGMGDRGYKRMIWTSVGDWIFKKCARGIFIRAQSKIGAVRKVRTERKLQKNSSSLSTTLCSHLLF